MAKGFERDRRTLSRLILLALVVYLSCFQVSSRPVTIDSWQDALLLLSQPDDIFQAWIDASNQCPGSGSSFITDIDRQVVKKVENGSKKGKGMKGSLSLQLTSVKPFCSSTTSLALQQQLRKLKIHAAILLVSETGAALRAFKAAVEETMTLLLAYLRDPSTNERSLAALSATKLREGFESMIIWAGTRFLPEERRIQIVIDLIRKWGLDG